MSNKFSYYLTPLAEQDIDSALDYIANQLCNGQAASDLFAKIENAIKNICIFPYSSADCTYFLVSDENIRHVLIDNYVLIYEIKEQAKQINILRFRYTRMDLTQLQLRNEEKHDND